MILILIASLFVIYKFVQAGNRDRDQRDLARTWKNLSPEKRAYVVAHYQQMKSEGRI